EAESGITLPPCGGIRRPDNALNVYYHTKVTKKHSMTHYVAWMERSGIRDNLAPLWWHQMAGQCFEYLLPHQSDEKALHDSIM
ncbi:MAG: hypothetical protein ABW104_03625, partial [Candidatus Thiodiazotropha sp. 6PLUC2]